MCVFGVLGLSCETPAAVEVPWHSLSFEQRKRHERPLVYFPSEPASRAQSSLLWFLCRSSSRLEPRLREQGRHYEWPHAFSSFRSASWTHQLVCGCFAVVLHALLQRANMCPTCLLSLRYLFRLASSFSPSRRAAAPFFHSPLLFGHVLGAEALWL